MTMSLILGLSIVILAVYLIALQQAIPTFHQLPICASTGTDRLPKISVMIPAFNEAENIAACVLSVLQSSSLPVQVLDVWVVDDQSTDATLTILKTLQQSLGDRRLNILAGLPRPTDTIWRGKNWACAQAAAQAKGEFLLFLDADVRLQTGALITVIEAAIATQTDLMTCIPAVVCGSFIEWLVQPLMFINVLVSFNAAAVKNRQTETAYALGPFMLFRRATYDMIGGHQAVADQVAEDVAFARRIKQDGFKLTHILGPNLVALRMYRSWSALWEGWTKCLYLGANRNLKTMLFLAIVMLMIYSVPWLGLVVALLQILTAGFTPLHLITLSLAIGAIGLQYQIRLIGSTALFSSTNYWWLQSLSGILIAMIAIGSVIKTETGWGLTWRGRHLGKV